MRVKYDRKELKNINSQIIIMGIIFVLSVFLGSFLNKMWPSYSQNAINDLNLTIEYYSQDVSLISNVFINLKVDFIYLIAMSILSVVVILFPFSILLFIIKGVSIGYTMNSMILSLKLMSFKMVFLTISKNIIIIPGMIIIIIVTIKYFREMKVQFDKKRKANILFLSKRYLINTLLISLVIVISQALINFCFMGLLKLFN
ncbi:MAG: hypothetical protein R3Y64_06070 [Peptostreptococcaceae bacterium]